MVSLMASFEPAALHRAGGGAGGWADEVGAGAAEGAAVVERLPAAGALLWVRGAAEAAGLLAGGLAVEPGGACSWQPQSEAHKSTAAQPHRPGGGLVSV